MSQAYRQKNAGIKSVLFGLIVVLFTGFIFTLTSESIDDISGNRWLHSLLAVITMGLVTGTFISMVTSTASKEKNQVVDNTFVICILSLAISSLELFSLNFPIENQLFYVSILGINCGIVYTISQAMFTLLKISGRWPIITSSCFTIATLFLGSTLATRLSLGGYEESIMLQALVVHGLITIIPVAIIALTYIRPSLRLSPHDINQSLKLRFQKTDNNYPMINTFMGITAISAMTFIASLAIYLIEFDSSLFNSAQDPYYPLAQLHLAWLPLVLYTNYLLKQENKLSIQSQDISTLVSDQAKKFLLRHHDGRKDWATTIGLRTANFMIDHDPNEDAKSALPSYMVRIRQTQIEKIVGDALKDQVIDNRVVSNQIYGAIDPETSVRSCTDILLMFTAIYLDGIPMIENRLKNLVRLLPILDSGLAGRLKYSEIESQFGKIEWFFHIDFDWLDQHMTSSSHSASYEVNIDNLRLRDRQRIMSVLAKHNLMGNFIWVGEKARERILLEAPYLANIIEAWPINLTEDEGESAEESVIFLIKFEQLIPRMQKYYNLEDTRKRLRYYDPSIESRRMINIIDLEIQQSTDIKGLHEVISLVSSYPWNGFKEKDFALELILKAFEKHQNELTSSNSKQSEKLINDFVKIVRDIGYPSQEIHIAHQEKMRIRKTDVIKKAMLDIHNRRFTEAWLLIATTPAKNYSKVDILSLLDGINKASQFKVNKKSQIITSKITEAFFNICQELEEDSIETISHTCNNIVKFLVKSNAEPDIFCFFIDAKIFLEGNLKADIILTKETIDLLQVHFSKVYESYGSDSSIVTSLSMRWKILMSQVSHLSSAS